jgi:RNA polymerase sigma factor (TIGR02999 family)
VTLDDAVALAPQRQEEIIALDEALEKLAKLDARQAQVVEMRFFGGMSVEEVASSLNVSKRTVEGDWTMARAWLLRELTGD